MNHFYGKNAVKIAVRERPIFENTDANCCRAIVNSEDPKILIVGDRSFPFDYVLGPKVTQQNLYTEIAKPLVLKCIEGFHCTALAYGQTGTGKSYSMGFNNTQFPFKNAGIIPCCLTEIFNLIDLDHIPFNIYVSFIEIYNEKVFDILSNDPETPINTKAFKFSGGVKKQIYNAQDGFNLLAHGIKNRHVRPTKMNEQSSRSHAIFTIHISKLIEAETLTSCFNLVDLAGSEGVRRTGHAGVALAEGVNINQGLLSLGKVLQALSTGKNVIPYRDSILTSVLQDSLKRNSFLTLLACISPLMRDESETISTVRFAQNAKSLKNYPKINSVSIANRKSGPVRDTNFRTPFLKKIPYNHNSIKRSVGKNNMPYVTPISLKKKHNLKHINSESEQISSKKLRDNSQQRSILSNLDVSNNSLLNSSTGTLTSSRLSFDTSTSTALDVATRSIYSPIIKNYLTQFECKMEEKIQKVFNALKSYDTNSQILTTIDKKSTPSNELELQDINNIVSVREQSKEAEQEYLQPVDSLHCNMISDYNHFKVPQLPGKLRKDSITDAENNCLVASTPKLSCLRRSIRLSSINNNKQIKDQDESIFILSESQPVRRSMRLSSIPNNNINGTSSCTRRSIRLSSNNKSDKENRSSVRLSSTHNNNSKRNLTHHKTLKEKKTKSKTVLTNNIINEYFNNDTDNLKVSRHQHENAVFALFNSGSIKELIILPQIGLKTAYQIVTHRTINGKFRNMNAVSKLPFWKGKSWERFKNANNIE